MPYRAIRTAVKRSHLFYRFVGRNIGSNGVLANAKSSICVEGFQRSGNTFLWHIAREFFPKERISHHTHSVANLKLALIHSIPCTLVIRRPTDAIISAVLYRAVDLDDLQLNINLNIDDYLSFYRFVFRHKDKFKIVEFTDLVNHAELLAADLFDLPKGITEDSAIERIQQARLAHNRYEECKPQPKIRSTIPNEDRQHRKAMVLQAISGSSLTRIRVADDLYGRIAPHVLQVSGVKSELT